MAALTPPAQSEASQSALSVLLHRPPGGPLLLHTSAGPELLLASALRFLGFMELH